MQVSDFVGIVDLQEDLVESCAVDIALREVPRIVVFGYHLDACMDVPSFRSIDGFAIGTTIRNRNSGDGESLESRGKHST